MLRCENASKGVNRKSKFSAIRKLDMMPKSNPVCPSADKKSTLSLFNKFSALETLKVVLLVPNKNPK